MQRLFLSVSLGAAIAQAQNVLQASREILAQNQLLTDTLRPKKADALSTMFITSIVPFGSSATATGLSAALSDTDQVDSLTMTHSLSAIEVCTDGSWVTGLQASWGQRRSDNTVDEQQDFYIHGYMASDVSCDTLTLPYGSFLSEIQVNYVDASHITSVQLQSSDGQQKRIGAALGSDPSELTYTVSFIDRELYTLYGFTSQSDGTSNELASLSLILADTQPYLDASYYVSVAELAIIDSQQVIDDYTALSQEVADALQLVQDEKQAVSDAEQALQQGIDQLQVIFETNTFLRQPNIAFGSSLFDVQTDDAQLISSLTQQHVITSIRACVNPSAPIHVKGLQVTYSVWQTGQLTDSVDMYAHGDMTGSCSEMSVFEGDRYSKISVYSDEARVNSIKIETDLGSSLNVGLSSGTSDEQFVLFERSPFDPLQFFGFEGFSTGGQLNGFRTIAYTRTEYDQQVDLNVQLAADVDQAKLDLADAENALPGVQNIARDNEIARLEEIERVANQTSASQQLLFEQQEQQRLQQEAQLAQDRRNTEEILLRQKLSTMSYDEQLYFNASQYLPLAQQQQTQIEETIEQLRADLVIAQQQEQAPLAAYSYEVVRADKLITQMVDTQSTIEPTNTEIFRFNSAIGATSSGPHIVSDYDSLDQIIPGHQVVSIELCEIAKGQPGDSYLSSIQVTYGVVDQANGQVSDQIQGQLHGSTVNDQCVSADTSQTDLTEASFRYNPIGFIYLQLLFADGQSIAVGSNTVDPADTFGTQVYTPLDPESQFIGFKTTGASASTLLTLERISVNVAAFENSRYLVSTLETLKDAQLIVRNAAQVIYDDYHANVTRIEADLEVLEQRLQLYELQLLANALCEFKQVEAPLYTQFLFEGDLYTQEDYLRDKIALEQAEAEADAQSEALSDSQQVSAQQEEEAIVTETQVQEQTVQEVTLQDETSDATEVQEQETIFVVIEQEQTEPAPQEQPTTKTEQQSSSEQTTFISEQTDDEAIESHEESHEYNVEVVTAFLCLGIVLLAALAFGLFAQTYRTAKLLRQLQSAGYPNGQVSDASIVANITALEQPGLGKMETAKKKAESERQMVIDARQKADGDLDESSLSDLEDKSKTLAQSMTLAQTMPRPQGIDEYATLDVSKDEQVRNFEPVTKVHTEGRTEAVEDII